MAIIFYLLLTLNVPEQNSYHVEHASNIFIGARNIQLRGKMKALVQKLSFEYRLVNRPDDNKTSKDELERAPDWLIAIFIGLMLLFIYRIHKGMREMNIKKRPWRNVGSDGSDGGD